MSDKVRELINRVVDYVIDHPATNFQLWQWDSKMFDRIKKHSPRWAFSFWFRGITGESELHYVGRDDNPYWSGHLDCTEENLEALLEILDGYDHGNEARSPGGLNEVQL